MLLSLDWENLLYLFAQIIGFLIGVILLTYGARKNRANIILGISFVFLTYASFTAWLVSSGLMLQLPIFYRTGQIFALPFLPLIYLYSRQVVKETPISWKDSLHFLPVLIYLIDFSPIYMLSSKEKIELIQLEISDPIEFLAFNQSRFFPSFFYAIVRTLMIAVYWIFTVRLIYLNRLTIPDHSRFFGKEWISWMKIFLFFYLLLFLPIGLAIYTLDSSFYYEIMHIPAALMIVSSGVTILFFPKVLYGMNEFEYILDSQIEKQNEEDQPQLTVYKIAEIKAKLIELEAVRKFYQTRGYAIRDLAQDTKIPSYLLTIYINRVLETNFSDFINEKRIEECARLMDEGSFSHFTLEGLAETCGFNNRNSFLNSFKKFKGMTPSAFKKSLGQNNLSS